LQAKRKQKSAMKMRLRQEINKDTATDIVLMVLLVMAVSILSFLEFSAS
jgi:hypothetical protein